LTKQIIINQSLAIMYKWIID